MLEALTVGFIVLNIFSLFYQRHREKKHLLEIAAAKDRALKILQDDFETWLKQGDGDKYVIIDKEKHITRLMAQRDQ